MVQKTVQFDRVRFPAEVIAETFKLYSEAVAEYRGLGAPEPYPDEPVIALAIEMSVRSGSTTLTFESIDEFLAEIRKEFSDAFISFHPRWWTIPIHASIHMSSFRSLPMNSSVTVSHPSRGIVERIFAPLETAAPKLVIPEPVFETPPAPKPRIFIGHGGSDVGWRDVKDHLSEQHGYDVVAFETGARSGHTIRDILDEMLNASSFAILVMSGEDEQGDGTLRARQNVIHEAGLFQGRLGFPRTVILREDGVEMFSNVDGIQYIGYGTGRIQETYGFILATLRREFPPA